MMRLPVDVFVAVTVAVTVVVDDACGRRVFVSSQEKELYQRNMVRLLPHIRSAIDKPSLLVQQYATMET